MMAGSTPARERLPHRSRALALGLVLRGVSGRSAASEKREPVPASAPAEPARGPVYLCALAFALATVAGTTLGVFVLPILFEQGFDASFAAAAVSLTGIAQALGRMLFTWLRPRYSLGFWSATLFLPFAASLGALALEPSGPVVIASLVVLAMTSGSLTLARTVWTLELFPVASFTRVNGVLGLWSLIARAGTPLAMGLWHDLFGSHRPGLAALATACFVGGAGAWLAARAGGERAAIP